MLPSWSDCARRAAANQYRDLIEAAGFQLNRSQPSAGAAIGTAVHKAAELMLVELRETGGIGDPALAIAEAQATFNMEISTGAEWDDTSPDVRTALAQIDRMARAYLPTLRSGGVPAQIESEYRADLGSGWSLTGKIDLLWDDGRLRDTKTGALVRPYQSQQGGYIMLVRAHGIEVTSAGTDYIARVRLKKPQPAPVHQDYDIAICQDMAWAAISEIKTAVEQFEVSGDPYSFNANPMSLMCVNRYCPARGTDFCKCHMPSPHDHGPID